MNTILDTLALKNTRAEAHAYLADKTGQDIKGAYFAYVGRKAPTVAKARQTLIGIVGSRADARAIRGGQ